MRPSQARLYPLISLVLLAGATLWLDRISQPGEPSSQLRGANDPDFVAENTRLTRYNPAGELAYTLLAEQTRHFPVGRRAELTAPRLSMTGRASPPVHLSSRRAEVLRDGEEIVFLDDVRLERPATPAQAAMQLTGSMLAFLPQSERAYSNAPVVLTQGGTRVSAQGMQADKLSSSLQLTGDVRARLAPRTNQTP